MVRLAARVALSHQTVQLPRPFPPVEGVKARRTMNIRVQLGMLPRLAAVQCRLGMRCERVEPHGAFPQEGFFLRMVWLTTVHACSFSECRLFLQDGLAATAATVHTRSFQNNLKIIRLHCFFVHELCCWCDVALHRALSLLDQFWGQLVVVSINELAFEVCDSISHKMNFASQMCGHCVVCNTMQQSDCQNIG